MSVIGAVVSLVVETFTSLHVIVNSSYLGAEFADVTQLLLLMLPPPPHPSELSCCIDGKTPS